ncbi:MAG: PQQ-binding-like beta-propeller repeat protein [Pirellulaceae bacterium]
MAALRRAALSSQPLRIGENDADAIVSQPEQGTISRLTGSNGEPKWSANLGSAIHNPTLAGEELLVATLEGTVARLDVATGQLTWASQLPQATATSPTTSQVGWREPSALRSCRS